MGCGDATGVMSDWLAYAVLGYDTWELDEEGLLKSIVDAQNSGFWGWKGWLGWPWGCGVKWPC